MQTLHESVVEESEIDELGHLSVPFYEQRALTASHELLSRCGLDTGALADQRVELTLVDAFSRNLREQFLGAPLAVQGGMLDAEGDYVRLYQQIVNTENDEIAAVYVQKYTLQSMASRESVAFEPGVLEQAEKARIDWPEHGRPRSLDLSRPPFQLSLEEARELR